MASSRVTSPPVSLKDRIAALEKRNNPNGHSSSPPPSADPARSLSPTNSTASQGTVNNLRDKITKFEKKGGTPIPRGSFGIGAPPPEVAGASKRKGELYGNRVPGLDRPTHTPLQGGRSVTAPLRPQMTGGDVLGLRPQMTGTQPTLRPQFTGDGGFQRRVASASDSSWAPGTSSPPESEQLQSYPPFVAPTFSPSQSQNPPAGSPPSDITPESASEQAGSSTDVITSSVTAASANPTDNTPSDVPSAAPSVDKKIGASEEAPVLNEERPAVELIVPVSVPSVKLTEPSEDKETKAGTGNAEIGLKSQGSAETLREATHQDSTSSGNVTPTTGNDGPSTDSAKGDSSKTSDPESTPSPPQGAVHASSPEPSPIAPHSNPAPQPGLRPQQPSAKVAQRPATHYDVPKATPYVEPEFEAPKPSARKSTFTAVVHRRTTVQQSARPATTYETTSTPPSSEEPAPPPVPRIPVQTVVDSDTTFSAEDLGALLVDAAMLEERLNFGPTSTSQKDFFDPLSLADTLSVGPKGTQVKHARSGSQMTIKAMQRQDSEPEESATVPVPVSDRVESDLAPAPTKTIESPSSTPSVIVAEPEPISAAQFPDFSVQELSMPSELGEIPELQGDDEVPPTPPPKSPPSSYLSSLRTFRGSNAMKRMSSLLPDSRDSVSSSDDSAPIATPPSHEFDAEALRSPPRHSKSYTTLRDDASSKSRSTRDDASFVSHESRRSKWSFTSPKKSKGLSRATTFADRIWPGSRNRNRAPSNPATDTTLDAPVVRAPSPGPNPSSVRPSSTNAPSLPPTTAQGGPDSRPLSWLSETSVLSSPSLDERIFDQFPSVPSSTPGTPPKPLDTTQSKYGADGTLLTPPDRGSSLSNMLSSRQRR